MKKIITTLVAVVLSIALNAQAPNSFNYQAVARGSDGKLLKNQNVSVRVSVLKGNSSGSLIYSETHTLATNKYGLINLSIGSGTVVSGVFNSIKWSIDKYFIKTDMDAAGGNSYKFMSTQQLMSVPYALHAKTVANDKVNDADADPTNEIQKLTRSGSIITLSKGGGTVIDNVKDADASPTNEIQKLTRSGSIISLSKGGGTVIDNVKDADASPTNEIQKLSTTGTNLLLSNGGGSVPLSSLNYWKDNTTFLSAFGKTISLDKDLYIGRRLGHYGDGNTYLDYNADQISLYAGSVRMIDMIEGTNDYIEMAPKSATVGIGTKPHNNNKLDVYSNGSDNKLNGIKVYNIANTTKFLVQGIASEAEASGKFNTNTYGIYGFGDNKCTGTSNRFSIGIYGSAYTSSTIGTGRSYGVYGTFSGNADVEYAGYFSGNIYTSKVILPSDANLKKDVQNLNSSIHNIMTLPVKTYNYKTTELAHMNLPTGRQTGIMAQDLEKTYPELVSKAAQPALSEQVQKIMTENGEVIPEVAKKEIVFKGVDYIGLVPHLVKAMQEQQKMIEDQKVLNTQQNALILQLQKDLEELKNK